MNVHHLGMVEAIEQNGGIDVTINGMTSLPNLVQIYQLVQKLLVWDIDGQNGDFINHKFIFRASRIDGQRET
jgi:hypothetical protein